MRLNPTSDDDPGFVRILSLILDSLVLQHTPEIVVIIQVDNWFDHKWLNFSGKVLGALGVWKHPLTIPPFHPNRVKAQTMYRVNQRKSMSRSRLLLFTSRSRALKTSIASYYTPPTLPRPEFFVWWSSNTAANAKGSLWRTSRMELAPHPGMFHLFAVTTGQSTKPKTFQSMPCLQFFELCRKFWSSGGEKLNIWTQEVKAGQVPRFGANLVY